MARRPSLVILATALALVVAQGCSGSDEDDGCPTCQPSNDDNTPFPPSVSTGQGRQPPSGGETSGGSAPVGGSSPTGGIGGVGGALGGGTGGLGATGGVFATGGTFSGGFGGF